MEIPGACAKVVQLGAESCRLAGEVLDTLLKCAAVRERGNAREYRLL
jgi:hypothetical protein